VQAFLDKEHDRPETLSPGDNNNNYALGRIDVLPSGEYTVYPLLQALQEICCTAFLMSELGIGGGAPSQKHDIRLGDIVVSASRNGTGSVFQYECPRPELSLNKVPESAWRPARWQTKKLFKIGSIIT
jgi:hypothetical protein